MGWPDLSSPPRWTGPATGRRAWSPCGWRRTTPSREGSTKALASPRWRATAPTPATKSRCLSVCAEVGPVAGDETAHIVHRIDGTVLIDGLDRHHRDVLVVGQVDPSPPRAGRERQPDEFRPRNEFVTEQISHLDS